MISEQPVVYIVDDDTSILTALTRLLRAGGYSSAAYASADEFVRKQPSQPVGCIIADLNMPGMSGMELQETLARAANPLPVIFLTGHGDIPTSVNAMRKGAEDFLTKPVKREQLFDAVERAFARNARVRETSAKDRELRALYESLTPREREVLQHVVSGQLNKQIAADINAAERTVKAHRASIMAKMGVQSVAELTRMAQALGI